MGPDALDTADNESGWEKYETGPDAFGIAENESVSTKHEQRDPTPSVPPKISPGAQNMQTGPDALLTAKNESVWAKYENGARRIRHRRKGVRENKT
jgi:hypothetical protein